MSSGHILGTKLRSARKDAGRERKRFLRSTKLPKDRKALTQSAVAKHMGISQSYLSKVETGNQEPGFLLVEKMCAYYGIKVGQLSTLSDQEQSEVHELLFEL
jgi:transcriptional regulator with XRE-family HTH domain